jgi:hypothetical protein
MAADQINFTLFTYVDDNGVSWNKRGEVNAARQAVDGSAAPGAHPAWGRSTRRHRARSITYVDATTFRKVDVTFYTSGAFAAVVLGTDTIAVHVPGNTAAVDYKASKKNAERSASATAGPQLSDHA